MAISDQIIQVINTLCEKFGIAINWTEENVIPYVEALCRKLITYEIATSVAWILFMAVLSIIYIAIHKKLLPILLQKIEHQGYDGLWDVPLVLSWIAVAGICIATFVVACVQAIDIIKCLTFPEMYVFEYISALAK